MSANSRQVGGAHYGVVKYQHWDWVCDIGLHYLLACATKYVVRWRDKNGAQDLEKAIHYLEKAKEREIYPRSGWVGVGTQRFCTQLPMTESMIVRLVCHGQYDEAAENVRWLLADATTAEQPSDEAGDGAGDHTDTD